MTMTGMEFRLKGSAIPKGTKWGWCISVIPPVNDEMESWDIQDDRNIFNTRREAVEHMESEVPKIKKLLDDVVKGRGGSESELFDYKTGDDWEPSSGNVPAPVKNLRYEEFIRKIYDKRFWVEVKKHAKYDFRFKDLKDFIEQEKPEPNIILISGMREGVETYEPENTPENLNLPFKTVVIEATDGTLFNLESEALPKGKEDVQVMFITELGDHYGFILATESGQYTWGASPKQDGYKLYMTVAAQLCNFITGKKIKLGQSKTNIRFKHKKSGVIKIKKLLHVSRTIKGEPVKSNGKFDVDWSHRWEVSGYWRGLPLGKVGKDRQGNYNQTSRTWVRPHVRGPEDKALVKKIRLVES